jgi:hypothetical protein
MMYANLFAAAIKVDGKILRETGDTVYLPFGSEYTIRLKNMSSRRAKVSIEIDGRNVTDGGLVLDSFQTSDLERFIEGGSLQVGNRFKFIERSGKVEEHRGVKLEDGLIQIKYEFEMPPVTPNYWGISSQQVGTPFRTMRAGSDFGTLNSVRSSGFQAECAGSVCDWMDGNTDSAELAKSPMSAKLNDAGITVEGSRSDQKFTTTHWRGTEGPINSMVLRLLGETKDNRPIKEAFTVSHKVTCGTCGTSNHPSSKFCKECGTSLQVFSSVL